MHTEGEIRKAIRPLIEYYGSLNTTEVKEHLSDVLDYDDDDKVPSTTRNEILITQRIGNIVAHQTEQIKIYAEGFMVDKSYRPAMFIAITGFFGKENVKSFDKNSLDKVIHLSAKQGDGFGYDITSINEKGEAIFIEVKTTKKNINTPFFMSKNEKSFFEENIENNAFIYRVYDFNEETRHGKIFKIPAKTLLNKNNYNFDPVSFLVSKK